MKLRTRLGLGIVSITIILLVPLILALRSLDAVHTQTRMLRDKEFAASLLLGNLRSINDDVKESETAVLLTNKPETFARIRKNICLLYTSDAADERSSVDLGGRRIIKK